MEQLVYDVERNSFCPCGLVSTLPTGSWYQFKLVFDLGVHVGTGAVQWVVDAEKTGLFGLKYSPNDFHQDEPTVVLLLGWLNLWTI